MIQKDLELWSLTTIKKFSLADIAKPPQCKKDFFNSDCEIGYLLDGKFVKQRITNKIIK